MKYRLPILIFVLLLTAGGIFLIQPQIESESVKPSAISNKPSCDRVKQCLRAERAWPSGMESCPKLLAPETARSRSKDGKWGYSMDFGECSKDTIISPRFDTAEKFGYNGLAKVSRDGKWGYVNLKGEEIIPLHYDEVGDFHDGLVPVKLKNKWGYFDAQGQIAVPIHFDAVSGIWSAEDGLLAVQLQNKWGYVNPRGETVIKPGFEKATTFQKGFAKVQVNQKWGVINTAGDTIIKPIYDAIFSTDDAQLFLVALNKKYGYVDSKGREIIPPHLPKPVKARYNSGGVQVVLNTEVLTPVSNALSTAAAPDVLTSAWYFIDAELRFDSNGKAQLWRNGEWFYITPKGMLVK